MTKGAGSKSAALSLNTKSLLLDKGLPCEEDDRQTLEKIRRTSDIFGKSLKEFELLVGHDIYSVPLIFHLCVGYFQHNPEKLKSEGLFRVAAGDHDIADLEIHLSF